jgi:hypothetical protein
MTSAVATWRRAAEAGDARLARTALAEDAVLISPLTSQFRFEGRDAIGELLDDVFRVLTGIRFADEFVDGDRVALFATGHVGDRTLGEAQRLRLDDRGHIRELTLYMRPIPAMTALLRDLGPLVARRQGRPWIARLLTGTGGMLDSIAAGGDARLVPLAGPGASRRHSAPGRPTSDS